MLNDMSKNTVAVCVTGQMGCDKLIRAGRELADRLGGSLVVMSALPKLYDAETARVLEYLYSCSAGADAKMLAMYRSSRDADRGLQEAGRGACAAGRTARSQLSDGRGLCTAIQR